MRKSFLLLPSIVLVSSALAAIAFTGSRAVSAPAEKLPAPTTDLKPADGEAQGSLVLAGGCFWCVEAVFEPLHGVKDVVSGYAGGSAEDADYKKVSSGQTQHAEVVKITYDPSEISFGKLLQVFFSTHDPLTAEGQHPDYGQQYRPAIFYANAEQKRVAEAYIDQLNDAGVFDKPIATGLEELEEFYPAEEYHQDYVRKNPQDAYVVRWAVPKIEKVGKLFPKLLESNAGPTTQAGGDGIEKVTRTDQEWRQELTAAQYRILREEGTERAFSSELNRTKAPGVFQCAGCGLPLFETKTKFDSGTGWPSFYQPIEPSHVAEKPDNKHGTTRTEIECARCGGHIGHVFNDGPEPTGLRYCMNGDALKFEPAK